MSKMKTRGVVPKVPKVQGQHIKTRGVVPKVQGQHIKTRGVLPDLPQLEGQHRSPRKEMLGQSSKKNPHKKYEIQVVSSETSESSSTIFKEKRDSQRRAKERDSQRIRSGKHHSKIAKRSPSQSSGSGSQRRKSSENKGKGKGKVTVGLGPFPTGRNKGGFYFFPKNKSRGWWMTPCLVTTLIVVCFYFAVSYFSERWGRREDEEAAEAERRKQPKFLPKKELETGEGGHKFVVASRDDLNTRPDFVVGSRNEARNESGGSGFLVAQRGRFSIKESPISSTTNRFEETTSSNFSPSSNSEGLEDNNPFLKRVKICTFMANHITRCKHDPNKVLESLYPFQGGSEKCGNVCVKTEKCRAWSHYSHVEERFEGDSIPIVYSKCYLCDDGPTHGVDGDVMLPGVRGTDILHLSPTTGSNAGGENQELSQELMLETSERAEELSQEYLHQVRLKDIQGLQHRGIDGGICYYVAVEKELNGETDGGGVQYEIGDIRESSSGDYQLQGTGNRFSTRSGGFGHYGESGSGLGIDEVLSYRGNSIEPTRDRDNFYREETAERNELEAAITTRSSSSNLNRGVESRNARLEKLQSRLILPSAGRRERQSVPAEQEELINFNGNLDFTELIITLIERPDFPVAGVVESIREGLAGCEDLSEIPYTRFWNYISKVEEKTVIFDEIPEELKVVLEKLDSRLSCAPGWMKKAVCRAVGDVSDDECGDLVLDLAFLETKSRNSFGNEEQLYTCICSLRGKSATSSQISHPKNDNGEMEESSSNEDSEEDDSSFSGNSSSVLAAKLLKMHRNAGLNATEEDLDSKIVRQILDQLKSLNEIHDDVEELEEEENTSESDQDNSSEQEPELENKIPEPVLNNSNEEDEEMLAQQLLNVLSRSVNRSSPITNNTSQNQQETESLTYFIFFFLFFCSSILNSRVGTPMSIRIRGHRRRISHV